MYNFFPCWRNSYITLTYKKFSNHQNETIIFFYIGLWCLTPLSTVFKLYRGSFWFSIFWLWAYLIIPEIVMVMVFNATFNSISVISWLSVLLVEEIGVPGENHRPAVRHWQTLSHKNVLFTQYSITLILIVYWNRGCHGRDRMVVGFPTIVAVSFIGWGNRCTRRKPPTCRTSLTNFITWRCIEYNSPERGSNSQR
jgi:hypothetical protein